MITFVKGNLLEAPVEALVNTVNTVGVMGKGIALMFKEAFPPNFRAYEEACEQHEIKNQVIGKILEMRCLSLKQGLSTALGGSSIFQRRSIGGSPHDWSGLQKA